MLNKKISKFGKVLVLGILLSLLLVGCGEKAPGVNNTNTTVKLESESAEDFLDILTDESSNFKYTNKQLLDELDNKVKDAKEESEKFELIDKTLYTIKTRGYKYESALMSLTQPIFENKEALEENDLAKVEDRLLTSILRTAEEDGYSIKFNDNFIMIVYDNEDTLDKYKDILGEQYVEAKKKVNKYSPLSLVNIGNEDDPDSLESTLKYEEIVAGILDLEESLKEIEYLPVKEEIQEVMLYYIGLLSGTVKDNLIIVDSERNIDNNVVLAFEEIEKEAQTNSLKTFATNMLELLEEQKQADDEFLNEVIQTMYLFLEEANNENAKDLDTSNPADLDELDESEIIDGDELEEDVEIDTNEIEEVEEKEEAEEKEDTPVKKENK